MVLGSGNLSGTFVDDELAMIPIYIGAGDEANRGLCTGTENYWCVNNEADEDDIQATLDFLYWCVTSEEGMNALANDMGFVIPFKAAVESSLTLFVKQDAEYTAEGQDPCVLELHHYALRGVEERCRFRSDRLAAGTGDWDGVVTAFVDGWASEYALPTADRNITES